MTLFRNWFSQALIHFKPQRRRNAVRLIDIAPEWFWAKGQLFSPWKIWSSPESVTRLSWQKLSAMEFPRIIFTSRSRTPPGSGHERRWSEHGTATIFNDAAEGKAISALFNGVPVSSTKSMMGHSLGAAGAVEAVFCLLALQHQFLPSNINFTASDDDLDLNIVANETRPAVLHTVLSNSFGFGGTNASILMSKFQA